MPVRNPAMLYHDQAVQTANGPHLLLMLLDRMAVYIAGAESSIEAGDYKAGDENLQNAQRAVRMLRNALDPEGFPGGHDLYSVYVFLEGHLVKANLEKSALMVRECAQVFRPIHEAWHSAVSSILRSNVVSHVG